MHARGSMSDALIIVTGLVFLATLCRKELRRLFRRR